MQPLTTARPTSIIVVGSALAAAWSVGVVAGALMGQSAALTDASRHQAFHGAYCLAVAALFVARWRLWVPLLIVPLTGLGATIAFVAFDPVTFEGLLVAPFFGLAAAVEVAGAFGAAALVRRVSARRLQYGLILSLGLGLASFAAACAVGMPAVAAIAPVAVALLAAGSSMGGARTRTAWLALVPLLLTVVLVPIAAVIRTRADIRKFDWSMKQSCNYDTDPNALRRARELDPRVLQTSYLYTARGDRVARLYLAKDGEPFSATELARIGSAFGEPCAWHPDVDEPRPRLVVENAEVLPVDIHVQATVTPQEPELEAIRAEIVRAVEATFRAGPRDARYIGNFHCWQARTLALPSFPPPRVQIEKMTTNGDSTCFASRDPGPPAFPRLGRVTVDLNAR